MEDLGWFKINGNIAFKQEDYHRALDFYNRGLMCDPDNYSLHCNMAQAYLCINEFCKAESHAVRAFQIKKDYVKAYYRAAKAALGSGDTDKALHFIERGIRACANPADLHKLKAEITGNSCANCDCKTVEDKQEDVSGSKSRSASMPRNNIQSIKINKRQGKSPADSQDVENGVSHNSSKNITGDVEFVQDNDKDILDNAAKKIVATKSRSASEPRIGVQKHKVNKKQRKGPVESQDFKNDAFYQTLKTLSNEVISTCTNSPSQSANITKEHIQSVVQEGSQLLEKGLPRKAAERYKEAHSILSGVDIQVYGWKEIEYSVLQYALCWSWIEALNYEDIVSSINMLVTVKNAHGPRLPAVHYALGSAYSRLNRYKVALQHIRSGIEFLNKEIVFEVHPWPGTNNIIKETTRSGLQESLNRLFNTCTVYHQPDAVCRYKACLSTYPHIIPSVDIFYSDPDFSGLVVVICQEDCRIQYHLPCWKNFKETHSDIEKLSDRGMLGMQCPTADCVTSENVPSVIIRIEIFGEDAELKSCYPKEMRKNDNVVKDSKKNRKKKEKPTAAIEKEPKRRAPKERKLSEQTAEPLQISSVKLVSGTDELSPRIKRLEFLRKRNFGYSPRDFWNPEEPDYGRAKADCIEKFKIPEFEEDSLETKGQKSFLYTYFVELLNSEGPIRLQYIIKKWESANFQEVKTFLPQYDGIVKFLLASCQCAVVEDTICLAKDLPIAYNTSKTDLVDGLNFTLMDVSSLEDSGTENNNRFVDSSVKNESISNNSDKATVDIVTNYLDNSSFTKLENRNSELPLSNIPIFIPASEKNETTDIAGINDSYAENANNKMLMDVGHKSENNFVKSSDKNTIEIIQKSPDYPTSLEFEDHNHNSQTSEMPTDSEDSVVKEMQLSNLKQNYKLLFGGMQSNSVEERLPLDNVISASTSNTALQSSRQSFIVTEQMKFKYDDREEYLSESKADNISVQTEGRKRPYFDYEFESNILPENLKEEEFLNKSVIASLRYPQCAFDENEDWVDESVCDIDVNIAPPPPAEFRDEAVLPQAMTEQNNSTKIIDISSLELPLDITEPASSAETCVFPEEPNVEDIMKQTPGELEKTLGEENKRCEENTEDNLLSEETAKLQSIFSKPIQGQESLNIKLQDSLGERIGTLAAVLPINGTKNNSVTSADKIIQVDSEQDVTQLKLEKLSEEISQKDKMLLEMKEKHHTELSQLKEKNNAERKAKDEMLELCKQMVNYIKYSEFKKLEIYKAKFLETKELIEIVNKSRCLKTGDNQNGVESLRKLDQNLTSVQECENKLKEWYNFQSKELNDGNIKSFRFPTMLPEDIASTHKTLIEIFEILAERHTSNSEGEENNLERDTTIKTTWDTEEDNIGSGKSEPVLESKTNSPLSHRPYQQYHSEDVKECARIVKDVLCSLEDAGLDIKKQQFPDLNSSTLHRSLATALMYDKSGRSLMDDGYEDEKLPNSVHTSDVSQLGAASLKTESNLAPVLSLANKEITTPSNFAFPYAGEMPSHQMKTQAPSEVQDVPKLIPSLEGAPLQYGHTKGTEGKKSHVTVPAVHTDKKNEFSSSSGIGSMSGTTFNFMQTAPVNYMAHVPINYPHQMTMNYPQPMPMPYPYPQHAAPFTVPSVSPVTTLPKQRAGELNIDSKNKGKLLKKLRAKFPFKKREEVEDVLSRIRKEKGHLSGMRVSDICTLLEKELDKSSKKRETGPMGMEKFGGSAWGDVKESVAWSKPQENEVDDCVICMDPLSDGLETLSCNHDFHKKCIRRWFKENRICPLCQVHANVQEEFPPLS
ncbi:uncharacterized protein LOC124609238 isoform X1 [Schistocerca americana]|uniref:uncharacterized protein LOC124609238 isoform X1 n=1 Tax=Schistocerca americana TaxID=7009 RepID=UPI001F4F631A|nr:uncharacterized protein LOC124609238 isoform X1 [Schistocerca americana]XP_046996013.1 uncharacterized protein LOC124609238 isoform X1 [Schistocerca americana]XP_046996014.1 uncharacterized protein LOC124609238 isoform X1 [Schistocerca americana]